MLGFSPISSNALGEIPSQQTSTALSAVLVSFSSIQAGLSVEGGTNLIADLSSFSSLSGGLTVGSSVDLYASILSSSALSSTVNVKINLVTVLRSSSVLFGLFAGTGSIGAGDRVEIRRLSNTFKITKV